MHLIRALYELLTGTPWTTGRQLSTDRAVLDRYGPPPAVRYPQLAAYSDAELAAHGPEIMAALRAREAVAKRPLRQEVTR